MKTIDQMLQELKHEPPADDIIQDLLPNSTAAYMLICGRSGIGKTNLALYLAFCVATGTPFFSIETKQKVVGYLSFEGGKHQIGNRLEKLENTFGSPGEYLHWEHSLPIKLNPPGTDTLKQLIAGLDVAIIDPLRPLVFGDWMRSSDASNFVTTLRLIQNDTGTVLILVSHIRKPDRKLRVRPEDIQFDIKGPTEYVDGAATVLLLETPRYTRDSKGHFSSNQDDRTLFFPKVKDAPAEFQPLNLRFYRDELLFKPLTEDSEDEHQEALTTTSKLL